jgi:hypothetical protein
MFFKEALSSDISAFQSCLRALIHLIDVEEDEPTRGTSSMSEEPPIKPESRVASPRELVVKYAN